MAGHGVDFRKFCHFVKSPLLKGGLFVSMSKLTTRSGNFINDFILLKAVILGTSLAYSLRENKKKENIK
jgi:hypothetical protein